MEGYSSTHSGEQIDNYDTRITNLESFRNTFLNLVYPIGSIYLTLAATNPMDIFGGTWEQIENKFLLGASIDYSIGSTGGEVTHTLTVNEMPSHVHKFQRQQWYGVDEISSASSGTIYSWKSDIGGTTSAGFVGDDWCYGQTGGNQSHNNMPPYIAVYIWKRIA